MTLFELWSQLSKPLAETPGAHVPTPAQPDSPSLPRSEESSLPAAGPRQAQVIVKYRAEGATALGACAEEISTRGGSFAAHTTDGSDSLDQIQARYRLAPHRALFRRTSDGDFPTQRARLRRRYEGLVAHHAQIPGGAPGVSSTPARHPGRHTEAPPDLSHVYTISVPAGTRAEEIARALRADPHVEYAQADYEMALDQAVEFDDPFLSSEGAWGQPYADLWGLTQVQAPAVWDLTQGEGVVVAVVDTGLDRFHPDIEGNVWVNPGEDLNGDGRATVEDENGIDDDQNGFIDDLTGFDFADSLDADEDGFYDGPEDVSDAKPFDVRGHGTHVSGTIAATAGNGIGIAGVAPRAKIMALRGFPEGRPASASTLWRAVLYAAENGAQVVNNSWTCSGACPENPLADDVLAMVEALGTVVVTSAGNASSDVLFRSPENGSRVITVGALGFTDLPASFSNRGWGIDVMAPGGGPSSPNSVRAARRNILSLLTSAIDPEAEPFSVGTEYWRLAGTSMSSPHVAGAVALLRSLRPELTPREIRRLIRMNSRDLGLPGHDPFYGGGGLDLPALLGASVPELELRIESPRPTSLHDPRDGPVVLRGLASGADLESLEVAMASGISGRSFETLEVIDAPVHAPFLGSNTGTVGTEDSEAYPVLASWDGSNAPEGPVVFRVRANLVGGRVVDEFLVVSIERNTPVQISSGELQVGLPALSGRRVVWPVAETEEAGAPSDIMLGRLVSSPSARSMKRGGRERVARESVGPVQSPRTALLFEREGDQDEVAIDGRLVAWRSERDGVSVLEFCLLERGRRCRPQEIVTEAGTVSAPLVTAGWMIWHRDFGGIRVIEGCHVLRSDELCQPLPLVNDPRSANWTPRSYDGETLLIGAAGSHALCRLDPGGTPCVPESIEVAPGTPNLTEPIHDGNLLAFREVRIETRPPPRCLPGEFIAGCLPRAAVVVRHRACVLEEPALLCDSVPISDWDFVEFLTDIEVSGRRIAWTQATTTEEAAVYYCEFDSVTDECTRQRVTGSAAYQDGLAIDGHRLVWRDSRSGDAAVWGTALPSLIGRSQITKIAGLSYSVLFRFTAESAGRVSYSVEPVDGLDPAETGARVVDPGLPGGRVYLQGVMPRDAAGVHLWRLRAETAGGLFSEQVIEVEVLPAPNDGGRK